MRLAVSGGGTGGHFFPAISVLKEASKRSISSLYVGSIGGIEYRLKDSIPSERMFFEVMPFAGKSPLKRIKALLNYVSVSSKIAERMREGDRVLTFGGYASVPASIAAIRRRKPLFIHEQNSVPGGANRLFSGFAEKVFITFEHSRRFFQAKPVVKTGLPVRESLLSSKIDKGLAKSAFGIKEREPTFLFIGGSQGARFLNNLAVEFARNTKAQVILISGEKEFEVVKEKSEGMDNIHIYPFRQDMGLVYSATDIAICRAGASTLSELSLFGIPAVMVPYPYAAGNHQLYNAKEIEELGGGITLKQSEANLNTLVQAVDRVVGSYEAMSGAISSFANPKAQELIVDEIADYNG